MFSQLNWCWHNPPCKAVFFVNLAQATINKTKQKLYTKYTIKSLFRDVDRFNCLTAAYTKLSPLHQICKADTLPHEHISITDYIGVLEAKLLTIFCIQVFTYISP